MRFNKWFASVTTFRYLIGFLLFLLGLVFSSNQAYPPINLPSSLSDPAPEKVDVLRDMDFTTPTAEVYEREEIKVMERSSVPSNFPQISRSPPPFSRDFTEFGGFDGQFQTVHLYQDQYQPNREKDHPNPNRGQVTDLDEVGAQVEEDCTLFEGCHKVHPPINPKDVGDLDGTFMQPASLPSSEIPGFFDEINSLGMNTVILQNLRTKGDGCVGEECCASGDYHWISSFPEKIDFILEQAAKHDIQIYVGLVLTTHNICPLSFYQEPNSSLTIEDTRITVIQLEEIYGSHPALAGWYIPDEPSLSEWIQPSLAYPYYAGLVNSIRRNSAKPILVSPHLTNITSLSPIEVARRAQSFRNATGVDILLWQDNAGVEGLKIDWAPTAHTIGDYFKKIVEMMGPDSTWSVHEAFNCCVKLAETETGSAYHPASMVRFSEQLAQAEQASVGHKISWIQQHHFGTVDPHHHLEADRLLSAYRAYFEHAGEFLMPDRYFWLTPPDLHYSDGGNEMFNWRIGDPNDFTNVEWVGIDVSESGYAELVLDLGEERVIEWIGFHILNNPEVGIHFPKELTLACFSKEQLWQGIDRWILPIIPESNISEYLFANTEPLSKKCSKVKATLTGTQWIFMSEVEMVAEVLPEKDVERVWNSDILIP